ncbi:MAG: Uncharacterised protein [Synechococcus sp. MIT S9220]|nr:MAG: Uncharacterised protein [Synechococcus sp. MIT S9220]
MGAAMHPASVVGLHFQGVNAGFSQFGLLDVVGKSLVAQLTNHSHDVVLGSQSCCSLDVREDLRVIGLICNPAHLGSLHGIPKADPFGVIPPGL